MSYREEVVLYLEQIAGRETNPQAYKESFDLFLYAIGELDDAIAGGELSGSEGTAVEQVFDEIEKVRLSPQGERFFLPSALRDAPEWQAMRDAAGRAAVLLDSDSGR